MKEEKSVGISFSKVSADWTDPTISLDALIFAIERHKFPHVEFESRENGPNLRWRDTSMYIGKVEENLRREETVDRRV